MRLRQRLRKRRRDASVKGVPDEATSLICMLRTNRTEARQAGNRPALCVPQIRMTASIPTKKMAEAVAAVLSLLSATLKTMDSAIGNKGGLEISGSGQSVAG